MDLNSILMWIVAINCGINLSQSWPIRHQLSQVSIQIPVGVLAVLGLGWQIWPQWAGGLAALTWGILWVLPLQLFRQVRELILSHRYESASGLATRIRGLYGLFEMPEVPILAQRLAQAAQAQTTGDVDTEGLGPETNSDAKTAVGRLALIHLYILQRQWSLLVDWLHPQVQLGSTDAATLPAYLRALGELGETEKLIQTFAHLEAQHLEDPGVRRTSALIVLAFGGQVDWLAPLLKDLEDFDRVFWLATARMAAGDPDAAQTQLQQGLTGHSLNPLQQQLLRWRLTHPLPKASLNSGSELILRRLQDPANWRGLEGSLASRKGGFSWLTGAIIGLNGLVFLIESLLGGSTNPQVLVGLGALIPPLVIQGQWWRLVAATVLHYGILHVALNMLGLVVLAPTVERALGLWRYALVYWGSGILSMALLTGFWAWGLTDVDLVVGASGSIMGLVGSTAAILLWAWLRQGSSLAQKQLRWIGFLVVLQTAFDLSTPEVSFAGHAGGLIAGFILTGLLLQNQGWQEP